MKTSLINISDFFSFKRILLIGSPGSGKSFMAKELAELLGIEAIHLDKLFWLPNWVMVSKEEFDQKLEIELSKDEWIIDGDFHSTLQKRISKASLIIYLDYDTQICIDSYLKRVETKAVKEFITDGCIEEVDPEFIQFIKDYQPKKRQENYEMIYNSKIDYVIFSNRQEKENFINKLQILKTK